MKENVELWVEKINSDKVCCFDIDGVLVENNFPDYDKGLPIQKNIDFVNELYDRGFLIILNTARGWLMGKDWYEDTEKQMKKYRIKYHYLYNTKPAANFYIDDRNISIEELKNLSSTFSVS